MKLLLSTLVAVAIFAADPFKELGTIRTSSWLGWEADTTVVKFQIYASLTNETNFALVGTVTTNRWDGQASKELDGWRVVYITGSLTNGVESDPSDKVLVRFRAGAPMSPRNIQIFTVVTAAATNALPPMPQP